MPGLFSRIGSAFSGSGQDDKLVSRIEDFARGYVVQSEVPQTLGLRHEEVAMFDTLLAEKLYAAYCGEQAKKAPQQKEAAHFALVRRECGVQLAMASDAQTHLVELLQHVADDLVEIARLKGKINSGFDSVDGLTGSVVSAKIASRAAEIRAIRRTVTH